MPRRRRFADGNYLYHVLNRAVGRSTLFETEADDLALQRVIEEARAIVPMRLLSYCLLPNHWHFVLWPTGDGDLSEYMRWLTVTHTARWHKAHETTGTGPIYQGRFKSFPIQGDDHFYTVVRYVERNALRASLVQRAEAWRWSSLWQLVHQRCDVTLDRWPLPRSNDWVEFVNQPQTEAELAAVRSSVASGVPFGSSEWTMRTATRLGLESTLRSRGRPKGQG